MKFRKFSSGDGYKTLYHISRHGPAIPQPGNSRDSRVGGSGLFLSDTPIKVWNEHGIRGKVHVYKVSNGLIRELGGMKHFDGANEIIIDKDRWESGIRDKKIIYKGVVQESKWDNKLKGGVLREGELGRAIDMSRQEASGQGDEKIRRIIDLLLTSLDSKFIINNLTKEDKEIIREKMIESLSVETGGEMADKRREVLINLGNESSIGKLVAYAELFLILSS